MAARATSVTRSPEFWNETPLAVVRRLRGLDETDLAVVAARDFPLGSPGRRAGRNRADVFTSGRTLSVKGPRIEGNTIVLFLRNGGRWSAIAGSSAGSNEMRLPIPSCRPRFPNLARLRCRSQTSSSMRQPSTVSIRSWCTPSSGSSRGIGPAVRSPKGAMGLMQLMPATARQYAVVDPFDPQANIEAGTRHSENAPR